MLKYKYWGHKKGPIFMALFLLVAPAFYLQSHPSLTVML